MNGRDNKCAKLVDVKIFPRHSPLPWTYNKSIQSLRGLSVLLVFASHTNLKFGYSNLGLVGVCIFFVISGYVITGMLFENLEIQKSHKASTSQFLRNFYIRRIRRLVPLAFTIMAVVCILEFVLFGVEFKRLLTFSIFVILYIPNFAGLLHMSQSQFPLSHYWSLGVEEQFYLVWPILIWWLYKKKNKNPISILVNLSLFFYLSHLVSYLVEKDIRTLPTSYADLLLFGCLVAIFNRYNYFDFENPKLQKILSVFVCSTSFLLLILQAIIEDRITYGLGLSNMVRNLLICIFFVSYIWTNFSIKPLEFLGDISYGFYLMHFPILLYLYKLMGEGVGISILAFFITTSLSLISKRYFEPRFYTPS